MPEPTYSPAAQLRFAMAFYDNLMSRANDVNYAANELKDGLNPHLLVPGLLEIGAHLKQLAKQLPDFFGEAQKDA